MNLRMLNGMGDIAYSPHVLDVGAACGHAPYIHPTIGIEFDFDTCQPLPLTGRWDFLYKPTHPDPAQRINMPLMIQTLAQIDQGGWFMFDGEGQHGDLDDAQWAAFAAFVLQKVKELRPDLTRCIGFIDFNQYHPSFKELILPNCEALGGGYYLSARGHLNNAKLTQEQAEQIGLYGEGVNGGGNGSQLQSYFSHACQHSLFARSHGKIPVLASRLALELVPPHLYDLPLSDNAIIGMLRIAWGQQCIPWWWSAPKGGNLVKRGGPDFFWIDWDANYPWIRVLKDAVSNWGEAWWGRPN